MHKLNPCTSSQNIWGMCIICTESEASLLRRSVEWQARLNIWHGQYQVIPPANIISCNLYMKLLGSDSMGGIKIGTVFPRCLEIWQCIVEYILGCFFFLQLFGFAALSWHSVFLKFCDRDVPCNPLLSHCPPGSFYMV